MCVTGATRHLAGFLSRDQIVGTQIGEHGHLGVEQSHVNVLAHARECNMAQCGQDAHTGVHAGEQIGDGHAHFLGATTQIVTFASDAHQAAHALHGVVIASTVAVRAGLAKTSHAAINQAGVDDQQAGGVQTIAGHIAHLEVFNEHIAMGHQLAHQSLTFGLGYVAGDGAFVAVGAQVISRIGGVLALCVGQEGRAPAAGVVTQARLFNLDDIGPQVGQGLGAPRPSQHTGEVKNADAV